MPATVVAVHRDAQHSFSKHAADVIELVAGVGVRGDAHAGAQVQHRSRVAADPHQPNLRQVHLISRQLFGEVAEHGFDVAAGDLGENITTDGIDLLGLPVGTMLRVGDTALLAVTGLRNPCGQINGFAPGLLDIVRPIDGDGNVELRVGIMAVVVHGGLVEPGDKILAALPPPPHQPLQRV